MYLLKASSLLASALAARAQQCAAGDQEVTTWVLHKALDLIFF